jgi:hypothetical protein
MNGQSINKGVLIAGGLLGLGLLGYLFFRDKKATIEEADFTIIEDPILIQKKESATLKKVAPVVQMRVVIPVKKEKKTVVMENEIPQEPNDDFPLKLGSKGERVHQLRVYLLRHHGTAGSISDEFTTVTEERVLRFLKVKEISEQLFQERKMDKSISK